MRLTYGNASGLYGLGRRAVSDIFYTRNIIAQEINCSPEEIYFTSGGTEGNNWIKNIADVWIRSAIEHKSVFKDENDIVIPVNKQGTVMLPLAMLSQPYQNGKINIISCQYVNNEIGTIQNIKYLTGFAHSNGFYFHTDAVQAFGKIKIDVKDLDVDYMTFSGHKIGAPKGIGFVYIRKDAPIKPFITGGQQEEGMRGGTENVPAIVALGKAVEMLNHEEALRVKDCADHIMYRLGQIENIRINTPENSIPHIISVSFKGITSEALMMLLDMDGIAVSAGSACSSHSLEPSHVLKAINVPAEYIQGTIRLSMYHSVPNNDIEYVCDRIKFHVESLRSLNEI